MSYNDEAKWAKAADMRNMAALGRVGIETAAQEREKEIPNRLSTLNYELNELQSSLDQLQSRLQPVIAPRPTNALCKKDVAASATGIGQAIFEATERIRFFTERIRTTIGELEI